MQISDLTARQALAVFLALHVVLALVAFGDWEIGVAASVVIGVGALLIPWSVWRSARSGVVRRDVPILILAAVSALIFDAGVVLASLPGAEDSADIGGGALLLFGWIGVVVAALAAPRRSQ